MPPCVVVDGMRRLSRARRCEMQCVSATMRVARDHRFSCRIERSCCESSTVVCGELRDSMSIVEVLTVHVMHKGVCG